MPLMARATTITTMLVMSTHMMDMLAWMPMALRAMRTIKHDFLKGQGLCLGPGVLRAATVVAVAPVADLDARVRHYAVHAPNGFGEVGIYRSYQRFADACHNLAISWNGRGKFPWDTSAEGRGFDTRREAENWLRERQGWTTDASIPHWQ